MKHTASCHCQNVRFEFESDLQEALICNCSICSRRGHVMHFVPESKFRLLTPEKALSDYQWGKKSIRFMFCSNCGIPTFGIGQSPDGPMFAINLRCLETADWEKVPTKKFDGKHAL